MLAIRRFVSSPLRCTSVFPYQEVVDKLSMRRWNPCSKNRMPLWILSVESVPGDFPQSSSTAIRKLSCEFTQALHKRNHASGRVSHRLSTEERGPYCYCFSCL